MEDRARTADLGVTPRRTQLHGHLVDGAVAPPTNPVVSAVAVGVLACVPPLLLVILLAIGAFPTAVERSHHGAPAVVLWAMSFLFAVIPAVWAVIRGRHAAARWKEGDVLSAIRGGQQAGRTVAVGGVFVAVIFVWGVVSFVVAIPR